MPRLRFNGNINPRGKFVSCGALTMRHRLLKIFLNDFIYVYFSALW